MTFTDILWPKTVPISESPGNTSPSAGHPDVSLPTFRADTVPRSIFREPAHRAGHSSFVPDTDPAAPYPAVAIVGAGGKTSLMALLAREGAREKHPLVLSTTTKLQRPCPVADGNLHVGPFPPEPDSYATNPVLWVGSESNNEQKWISPPLAAINDCLELPIFRLVVEADGAAGRPIKAAGIGEPVIPEGVGTVVAVLGITGLGRRADSQTVHRLPAFLDITGLKEESIITMDSLLKLVRHRDGSFKGTLPKMRRILLVNQADSPENIRTAEELGRRVLDDDTDRLCGKAPIDTVVIASLRQENPIHSILKARPNI